jgi:hypothetical protein
MPRWPNVKCPFFAVYAEYDTNVRRSTVEAALPMLRAYVAGVRLAGETHGPERCANAEARRMISSFLTRGCATRGSEGPAVRRNERRWRGRIRARPAAVPCRRRQKASLGNCRETLRLAHLSAGTGIRALFPCDKRRLSLRHPGSTDLKTLLPASQSLEVFLPPVSHPALGAGVRWRVVEVPRTLVSLSERSSCS